LVEALRFVRLRRCLVAIVALHAGASQANGVPHALQKRAFLGTHATTLSQPVAECDQPACFEQMCELDLAAADLLHLSVPLRREPLALAPELPADLVELRGVEADRSSHRGLLQDVLFGNLRVVEAPHFGDGALLLVRQRLCADTLVSILLSKTLHRQFERSLRTGVFRHEFSVQGAVILT